jgi:hypothetical protein
MERLRQTTASLDKAEDVRSSRNCQQTICATPVEGENASRLQHPSQAVIANLDRAAELARALSSLTPAGVEAARVVATQVAADGALVRDLLLQHADALGKAQVSKVQGKE